MTNKIYQPLFNLMRLSHSTIMNETEMNLIIIASKKVQKRMEDRELLIAFIDYCDRHNKFPLQDTEETIQDFLTLK